MIELDRSSIVLKTRGGEQVRVEIEMVLVQQPELESYDSAVAGWVEEDRSGGEEDGNMMAMLGHELVDATRTWAGYPDLGGG